MMAKISYDPEVKILNIRLKSNKAVKDSDVQQNCIIDYDEKGEIINIEVLDMDIEQILRINKKGGNIST